MFALCCLTAICSAQVQAAKVPVPDDTVADRLRPELLPLGVHVGAFTLFPDVGVQAVRRNNIYSQGQNPVDDTVTVLNPRIQLRSNWSRHSMIVAAEAEAGRFLNNSAENYDDTRLTASGRITVSRNSGFRLAGRLASLHEDRFSADNRQGSSPTRYDQSSVSVGYQHNRARLTLEFDVALTTLDFDDVESVAGTIDNDDRDRERQSIRTRAAYEITPDLKVYAHATLTSLDYTTPLSAVTFARSSSGGEVAVGATFDPTPLTTLDAFIGYAQRDYDDRRFEDLETPVFGATLTWRVSGLTTVTATALRGIEETALNGAGGLVATRIAVGVDHELLRNLLLHASVFRRETDFAGIERKDEDSGSRLAATYLMNRRLTVEFEYESREREFLATATPQDGFDTGAFSLSIRSAR
jgi:hypothetical protein